MSNFLSSFLGLDLTVWHIIIIPIIIALFEFIKSVIKKVKESISVNTNTQTVNVYKGKEGDNESHELPQSQINETVRALLKIHLNRIRKEFGVDRVIISKFHNGNERNEVYPGDVFQVFSIIEESLSVGISSEKRHLTDIPATFFKSLLDPILNNGWIIINDVEQIKNSDLKYVLKNYGVQSLGGVGIFDPKDNLIGILFIEYVRSKKPIDTEHIQKLKESTPFYVDHINNYKLRKGKKV